MLLTLCILSPPQWYKVFTGALSSRQVFKFLVLQMKKSRLSELELFPNSPSLPGTQGLIPGHQGRWGREEEPHLSQLVSD